MIRTIAVWAWLLLRFAAAIALLYVAWTLTFMTSLAALPLLAIAALFTYCTLKETAHGIARHSASRPHR